MSRVCPRFAGGCQVKKLHACALDVLSEAPAERAVAGKKWKPPQCPCPSEAAFTDLLSVAHGEVAVKPPYTSVSGQTITMRILLAITPPASLSLMV